MDNPYTPPKAPLQEADSNHLTGHVIAPMLLLAGWGLLSLVLAIWGLAVNGPSGLPLWFVYLALAPALLTLCSAYALWRRSAWVIALVVAAALLRALPYFVVVRDVGPSLGSSIAAMVLQRLSPRVLLELGAYFALAMYCAFLRKWGQLR